MDSVKLFLKQGVEKLIEVIESGNGNNSEDGGG